MIYTTVSTVMNFVAKTKRKGSNLLVFFFIILGDPGAASREDVIFPGERYFWAKAYFKSRKEGFSAFEVSFPPKISLGGKKSHRLDW